MQIVAAHVSLVGLWGIGLLNLLTKVVVELLDEEEAAEEDRSNNGTLQTCKVDPTSYSQTCHVGVSPVCVYVCVYVCVCVCVLCVHVDTYM